MFGVFMGFLMLLGGGAALVMSTTVFGQIMGVLGIGFGTLGVTMGWGLNEIFLQVKKHGQAHTKLLETNVNNTYTVAKFFNERDVKIQE